MALDFSKQKQKFYVFTYHDGTKGKLPVATKRIYDAIQSLSGKNDLDEIYGVLMDVLQQDVRFSFTKEDIEEMFSLGDIFAFFNDYVAFTTETFNNPNSNCPSSQGMAMAKGTRTKYSH